MMTSERVFTRGARILNDGIDEEALPEDRIVASDLGTGHGTRASLSAYDFR
jgi:hypothetical protein